LILLALPAYNEEHGLAKLLEAFQQETAARGLSGKIIIVDDGSTDDTARVIRAWSAVLDIECLRHETNRGLGETIQDALRRAVETAAPEDVIVTMDADNTHAPALIPAMAERLGNGYDLVIASRYRPGARMVGLSKFRTLACYGARFLFQLLFPTPGLRDYTCGFRAYRPQVLREAFSRHNGTLCQERSFACMAEILLKLRRMGIRISELPLVLRYDQKSGASKMAVGPTVWKTLSLMARARLGL
jgi:dolichol-phosphate mannosyltransferase